MNTPRIFLYHFKFVEIFNLWLEYQVGHTYLKNFDQTRFRVRRFLFVAINYLPLSSRRVVVGYILPNPKL